MRTLYLAIFLTSLALSAQATDLGVRPEVTKPSSHVLQNPGTPDARDGGETVDDAIVIPAIPFIDSGNTADNLDDYDVACPYTGSTSPDVVYSYTPPEDEVLFIDLCGSSYDTKVYVLDADLQMVACNDDAYFSGDPCGTYVSAIEEAYVFFGHTYYIVIDGYGGGAGDYQLAIQSFEPPPPFILECPPGGLDELEPALGPGYVDTWNSGCNSESGFFPFQQLYGDCGNRLDFCGSSGWLGDSSRDTDWFIITFGDDSGLVTWTMDAEQESFGFVLSPQDCDDVGVIDQMQAGPCNPAQLTIQGYPGEEVWIWMGPSEYDPPPGFVGFEYNYFAHFEGIYGCDLATEEMSFDRVKSLYR